MGKQNKQRKYKKITLIKEKGITIIALVITIIILLILAGITINLTIGQEGIFEVATKAKEEQKIAEITEKLELVKPQIYVDNNGTGVEVEEYLQQIQKEGTLDFPIGEIERVDEDNAYIVADGKYEYLLEHEENGNLKITYQGKVTQLPPRIVSVRISNTTNSITVKVEAKKAEEYKFYITDNLESEYQLKEEKNKTGEYTYSGLTQNKKYYIKVEAINKNGKAQREITRTTATMIELTQAELQTSMNPNTWTNKNVTTIAKINTDKNISNYKLQYIQTKGSLTIEEIQKANWQDYSSSGIVSQQNETIYFRLYDGYNSGSYMSRKVTIIDKEKPTVNSIKPTTNIAEIVATDIGGSGIVSYALTTTLTEPTDSFQTSKTFNNLTQNTTYYAWVKDTAGNISVSKSFKTGTVTTATGNITFRLNPNTWTNGNVTATASTTGTGFILQTSKDGNNWFTTATQTFTANGTIYARLVDSTNQYNGTASTKITLIDKTVPNTASIVFGGATSQASLPVSINARVTHSDSNSGIKIGSSRYVINTIATAIGTNESSYTGGSFSSNGQTITLKVNGAVTCYLHVLSIDNAGNKKETIKGPIRITPKYHAHTGNSSTKGGCYTAPVYHKHTGNSSTKGGCYSVPVYHNHNDGYCNIQNQECGCRESLNGQTSGSCWKCGHPYQYHWGDSYCEWGVERCIIPTTQIMRYSIGCGKTTSTIEKYNLSCNKTTSVIDSYTISY